MPVPVYSSGWDVSFIALLRKKIGAEIRRETSRLVTTSDDILVIAEKFLKFYRANLTLSSTLTNLQIPSLNAPKEGYGTKAEATSTPLWGAIGIPRSNISSIMTIINKISLDEYADLTIFDSKDGNYGLLSIDFTALSFDAAAAYYDGTTVQFWPRLIEYGFDVPQHIYLRKSGYGRSGYGIMGKAAGKQFRLAATHVLEDTFNETIKFLSPADLLRLRVEFKD